MHYSDKKIILNGFLLLFCCCVLNMQAQQTIIENFSYTGGPQYWTVPNCVTSINVTIAGAEGGGTYSGSGAVLTGTLNVIPGQQLEINVGGAGFMLNGGWNGGGNGATANTTSNISYGGGGASDIRISPFNMTDRVVVAGGGGGMGGGNTDEFGGHGGCNNGQDGTGTFGDPGDGGTQNNGGNGGTGWVGWTGTGNAGFNGSLGVGGNGGNDQCFNVGPGGGGGGGYYGGGGGGADCYSSGSLGGGGGGGGSSFPIGPFTCAQGINTGNGYVEIEYTFGVTYGTDYQTHCDTFTWINGVTYSSSNFTDTDTLVNSNGCDSIITLNLNILNPTYGTDYQTHCVSYTWVDGNTYTSNNNTATYTYANANSNGCDSIVTLDLTINSVSYHTDYQTHCDSYTWIDGNTYTSNNNSASFTYPNANSLGCDSIVILDLTIIQTPQTSAGPDVSSCSLEATLSANTPIGTGTWYSNNNVIIDNVNDAGSTVTAPNYGTYTFYWFDDNTNGCISVDSMIVNFYETPIANAGNNAAICGDNHFISAIPSIGVGSWSTSTPGSSFFPNNIDPQTNITNPGYLTTTLVWTEDNNGCVDSDYITIAFTEPSFADAGDDVSICSGDNIVLNAQGGNIYNWAPAIGLNGAAGSSPTANPNDTTTYTVTVTNQSSNAIYNGNFEMGNVGFSSDYSYNDSGWLSLGQNCVGFDASLAHPNFSGTDHTSGSGQFLICNGDTLPNQNVYCTSVDVTQNTEYNLSFWVCNLSFSFLADLADLDVTINGVSLGSIQSPYLENVWDNFNSTWNSGNNTIANICISNINTANNLNDFGIDDISFITMCTSSDDVTVNVIESPNANANIDEVICGDTYQLNAIPSVGNGVWSSTSLSNFSDASTSNSNVTVSDYSVHTFNWTETNEFCIDTDEVEVVFTAPPSSFGGDSIIICPGEDVEITNSNISNFTNFYWTTSGDGTFSDPNVLKPQYFYGPSDIDNQGLTLTLVTENAPCPNAEGSVDVTIRQKPTAYFSDDIEICDDGSIANLYVDLVGIPPFNGIYFNGNDQVPFSNQNTNSFTIETNESGDYSFIQLYDKYCEGEGLNQATVTVHPMPQASFSFYPYPSTSIESPNVNFFNNSSASTTWEWNFGDSTYSYSEEPSHSFENVGIYDVMLIATNQIGCSDSIIEQIQINPSYYFFVPDAFTPNGDNVNDCFIGVGKGISEFHMSILNRWGETIFKTSDIDEGWCGITQNSSQICPNGVYSYRIDVYDEMGKHYYYTGEVSLFR